MTDPKNNVVLVCEESIATDARRVLASHLSLSLPLGSCFGVKLYTVDSNTPTHYWIGHRITPGGVASIIASLAVAGVVVDSPTVPCVSIYVGLWDRAAVLADVKQKSVALYVTSADERA